MQSVVAPERICVVSPHLDDGVFGCGRLLASHPGCTVLTVFAGPPLAGTGLTSYDARCGFKSSAQAMTVRLAEDDRALASLNAVSLRMKERDSQYAALPDPGSLADRLRQLLASADKGQVAKKKASTKFRPVGADRGVQAPNLARWDAIVVPLGLVHCDHECVSDACLHLVRQHPEMMWIGYEDVLYRRRAGVLQKRLINFWAAGVMATPITVLGTAASGQQHDEIRGLPVHCPDAAIRKARAVSCYASQLKCLGIVAGGDDGAQERYWFLKENEGSASRLG